MITVKSDISLYKTEHSYKSNYYYWGYTITNTKTNKTIGSNENTSKKEAIMFINRIYDYGLIMDKHDFNFSMDSDRWINKDKIKR